MDTNGRWVIALDHTKMDNDLLKYVFDLCKIFPPEKIFLINVLKERKSYSHLPEEFFGFMNQVEEDIKLQMQVRIDKYLGKANIPFEILIAYGSPFDEIIQMVMNKSASLVIVGRKHHSSGSGVISDRLSRNLPCDVLVVPEGSDFQINNVLLPTDFSAHSKLALDLALKLKEINMTTTIYPFHGYEIPMGYSRSGNRYNEFAEIMKSNAEKVMKLWVQNVPYDIHAITRLAENSLADLVVSISTEKSIDLIIMGSKGQSPASLALLGSQTMKVIVKNKVTPLLIVKKPGENINFIQALKQI